MEFESLNARDGGEGERRWEEAGRPTIPTVVVDGTATPILHVSQLAEALGLTPPASGPPDRDAADAAAILDAWVDRLRTTPWPALLEPTPARGRSLRNLTVNAFHPFELLPAAWASGEFDWRPEDDAEREAPLSGPDELIAYAEAVASGWRGFVDEHDLADADALVDTSRGAVPFSTIVAFQRWHAAYHYRQLLVVLGEPDGLQLLALEDLELPSEVF